MVVRHQTNRANDTTDEAYHMHPSCLSQTEIYRRLRRYSAICLSTLILDISSAQTAGPPAPAPQPMNEAAVELSPFVVGAETEQGYMATSTLAGGRTKMELRDVAAQVSVFTSELMKDMGATKQEEMLLYSSNVESPLEFNLAVAAGFGSFRNTNPTRSRGLAGLSPTRNGFPTALDSDNYNVDRTTIISGPNALLFGSGSPAGISDTGLNRAMLNRTKGQVVFMFDNESSERVSLDANTVLIPNRVALRLDGVRDRRKYWIKPGGINNDRFSVAVTAQPSRTTTVRFHGEWIDQLVYRAATQLPSDGVSLWLDRGAVPYNNSPAVAIAGTNSLYRAVNKTNYVYGNVSSPGVLTYINGAVPRTYYDVTALPATAPADAGVVPPLVNPAILPANVNMFGLGRVTAYTGASQIASVEQKLGQGLFAELGFQHETAATREGGLLAGNANGFGAPTYTVNVDPNRFLPDGVTPNPNIGKYYVEGSGGVGFDRADAQELRLTLTYDLSFAKRPDVWKWLGSHRIMAFGSVRDTHGINQGNNTLVVGAPSFVTGAAISNLAATQRRFSGRYYLDKVGQGSRFSPEMAQSIFGPWTFKDPGTGKDFQVFGMNNPGGSDSAPLLNRQRILSRALAETATIWQGHLVLLAGWRDDRARTRGALPADTVSNATGMFLPINQVRYDTGWNSFSAGQSMTYGAVYHPWLSKWLSFHYSSSDNYTPPGGTFNPFDQPMPGSSGVGKDYGVRVEFGEGRYAARLNFFENNQVGVANVNSVLTAVRAGWAIEQQMETLNPSMPKEGMHAARPSLSYADAMDSKAKGIDLELTASPTKNWRIFGSVGRQHAVTANTASAFAAWFSRRLPVWQSYPSFTTGTLPNTSTLLKDAFQTNVYNAYYYILAAGNGSAAQNEREWRGNLLSNYTFRDGLLRGWTAGGGVRYRSRGIIGYPLAKVTTPTGATTTVPDIGNPFHSAEQITFDALLRYQFKPSRKTTCEIQLNVRNVFDANKVVAAAAYTTGAVSRYFSSAPRTAILETTVGF